jgi:hypothetical protein
MKWIKLSLSLVVFVPGCAVLGAFSTLDSGFPLWWGLTGGSLCGTFFGMVFGGVRGGIVGIIYPPADDDERNWRQ